MPRHVDMNVRKLLLLLLPMEYTVYAVFDKTESNKSTKHSHLFTIGQIYFDLFGTVNSFRIGIKPFLWYELRF